MTWVKIDDEFYAHPKVARLRADVSLMCIGLHMKALCWCNHQLTDGHVPRNQVFALCGDLSLALPTGTPHPLTNELVRVGMWEDTEDGFLIHDFLDFQPSKEQVLATKAAQSKAGRETAEKRWGTPSIAPPIAIPIAPPVGQSCSVPVPVPVPVPDPEPVPEGKNTRPARTRQTHEPYTSDFESFWSDYPRKEGKGKAFEKWRIARRSVPAEVIQAGLLQSLPVLQARGKKYVPMPETWLHQRRWGDSPEALTSQPAMPENVASALAIAQRCEEQEANRVTH